MDRLTGAILWQKTALKAPLEAKNGENSYASSTPSTDGERVYVSFLETTNVFAAAFDFTGKQLWQARPGTFKSQWGFCSPPQIFEDKISLSCDSMGENFLVALSRDDGRIVWKTLRDKPSQSYGTPLIAKMSGRDQIVLGGNSTISSYNPKDGSLLWFANGPASDYVASPAYNERAGLVLADTSWPKRVLMAVKPDGHGDVSTYKVAWSTTEGAPYVPSPVAVGDYFLTSSFNKEAYCFEASTGKILWHEKVGLHHASPVVADGLVYFLNDDGVMHVIKAGSTFDLVARNELGEKTYASPAISNGRIFLRGFENLYCIGQSAK
jgi:outer membrane protein assembly factor BamB